MNGLEQKQRFTAVSRVERRCDDVETVVEGLAAEIVQDRARLDERMQDVGTLFATHERDLQQTRRDLTGVTVRFHTFETRTLWQRLCWIVRGV
jgi:hypothetical protein